MLESIPMCPEFFPSAAEFGNFEGCVESLESQAGDSGIFKV